MASSLMVMSDPGSGIVPSAAASSCSSSRPIIASRRAPANFDFSAYLISASPPGFELSSGVFSCGLPPSERLSTSSFQVAASQDRHWSRTSSASSSSHRLESGSDGDVSPATSARSSLSTGSRPGSNGSGGGLTKKVSFADDLGMLLEQICVFYESSDTPPTLSPKVLRRYASVDNLAKPYPSFGSLELSRGRLQRLSASMPSLEHEVVNIPRLLPNFSMPAANRFAYLERIDCACVSLESVRVLPVEGRPGAGALNGFPAVIDRLVGSVAVRNLAFEKSVTARCTFDGWVSYVNVRAVYARSERVDRGRSHGGLLEFDVFEFSVNLPVRWRTVCGERPRVELAIRYDVAGKTFWDNNHGQNYELVGTADAFTRSRHQDPVIPCWTEFSGWSNVDTSCPYW